MILQTTTISSEEIENQRIAANFEEVKRATWQPPIPEFDGIRADEIVELYRKMTEDERRTFDLLIRSAPLRSLMAHQIVPWDNKYWEVMLLIGGRGTGKTVCGATAVRDHLRAAGKKARIGIAAPTNADARDTCMEGETGLITMFPNEFVSYNRSLGEARHINGGIVKAMGTEKPKRWNGPQWSLVWFDELALCNQAAWDDANLGLRLANPHGPPRAICTTTPKNSRWVKLLAQEMTTYVPQYVSGNRRRLPTTFDNPFLPEGRVLWLKNKYGGSRLGRQELEGEFIDDVAGSMWKREWFVYPDKAHEVPRLTRIVVAIDPAGSVNRRTADQNALTEEQRQNHQKNADTAIAVVGLGVDGRFYVLDVSSGQWTPKEWAKVAIRKYHQWRADKIITETNFGGDMVEHTLRNFEDYDNILLRRTSGRFLPIKRVVASKSKHIRAEPVAVLYEQRRVTHVIMFSEAEDQMCAFVDADENEGADMVDAIVWGISELGGLAISEGRLGLVKGTGQVERFVQCH